MFAKFKYKLHWNFNSQHLAKLELARTDAIKLLDNWKFILKELSSSIANYANSHVFLEPTNQINKIQSHACADHIDILKKTTYWIFSDIFGPPYTHRGLGVLNTSNQLSYFPKNWGMAGGYTKLHRFHKLILPHICYLKPNVAIASTNFSKKTGKPHGNLLGTIIWRN